MGTNQPPAADARPLQVRVNLPFSKGLITHVGQPSLEEIDFHFLVSSAPDITFVKSVLQPNPVIVCAWQWGTGGRKGNEEEVDAFLLLRNPFGTTNQPFSGKHHLGSTTRRIP